MIIQLKNPMPANAIASWQPKLRELLRQGSLTLAGLAIFILCWAALAANLQTSLGQFPGPTAVAVQFKALIAEHQAEKINVIVESISNISDVIQTNSATSEESAAAAEELSSQSEVLKRDISEFITKK